MRGKTFSQGVVTLPVSPQAVEDRAKDKAHHDGDICQTPHLFCYPAQSNFSGWKYPLNYVKGIQGRYLYPACDHPGRWFVLLDAASYISSSLLDLQKCPADFVPISFYKLFGFPTGLGALLVRNNTASMLKKAYFGGGTAAAYLSGEDYYLPVTSISDRWGPLQDCQIAGFLWMLLSFTSLIDLCSMMQQCAAKGLRTELFLSWISSLLTMPLMLCTESQVL